MKKRIFMGLTALAIMANAITATITSINVATSESDLLSVNIEVLTQNETVEIPCVEATSTCTYKHRLANGQEGTSTVSGLKNVD